MPRVPTGFWPTARRAFGSSSSEDSRQSLLCLSILTPRFPSFRVPLFASLASWALFFSLPLSLSPTPMLNAVSKISARWWRFADSPEAWCDGWSPSRKVQGTDLCVNFRLRPWCPVSSCCWVLFCLWVPVLAHFPSLPFPHLHFPLHSHNQAAPKLQPSHDILLQGFLLSPFQDRLYQRASSTPTKRSIKPLRTFIFKMEQESQSAAENFVMSYTRCKEAQPTVWVLHLFLTKPYYSLPGFSQADSSLRCDLGSNIH